MRFEPTRGIGFGQLHRALSMQSEFYCTANNPPPAQYASYPTAIC